MKTRKEILDDFWSIYETEGAFQALSWFDTLKYYEDYCSSNNEMNDLSQELQRLFIQQD